MERPLVTLMALSLASPAWAGAPDLEVEQIQALESGEVIVEPVKPPEGSGIAVRAFGIIDAPLTEVWPVVNDCGKYREFMPRTKESEERVHTERTSVCYVKIGMPWPLKDMWSETNVVRESLADGSLRRTWSMRKGTYKRNKGSWTLFPHSKGTKTLAVYDISVEPDIAVPTAWIRSAQAGSLPDVFVAIRDRVGTRGAPQ